MPIVIPRATPLLFAVIYAIMKLLSYDVFD